MAGTSSVHVRGNVEGQVVVGTRNVVQTVVVNADRGSSVTVRPEGPPRVRRRDRPAGPALPRHAPALLGRERELARLHGWLADGHPVFVYGPPGVGKSSLLRRVATDRAAASDGGEVVHLPAAGLPVEDIVQDLFHACFETEDYKPGRDRMRRLMGSVQALLVVDDFHGGPDDLAALVDAAPGCQVLVAGDEPVAWDGAKALRLEGLSEADALALLALEAGRPLRRDEADAAGELVAAVRGHPLTLVQAAGAVAAAERVSGTGCPSDAGTGFAADEPARAVGLAGRLSDEAGRLLRLVRAFDPLPLSSSLLAVLAGEPVGAAVVELEALALLGRDGAGCRAPGRFAGLVAERSGAVRGAAGFAVRLTEWMCAGASRHEVAVESAVICHVLTEASLAGEHPAARDLARAAAPLLARTLRWGAWRKVLELGLEAARSLESVEDVEYFTHEEQVRRRTLGIAAGAVAGTAAGLAAVVGQNAAHGGAAAPGATHSGAAAVTHPVVIGIGVAAVVAGGVFMVGLAGGSGGQPEAGAAPASGTGVRIPSASDAGSGPSVSEAGPGPSGFRPPKSGESDALTDGPRLRRPPSRNTDEEHRTCKAVVMPTETFGAVAAEQAERHRMEFAVAPGCGDADTLAVDDRTNWKAESASCPAADTSGTCTFDVVFTPRTPGLTYSARVTMLDASRHESMTLKVTGTSPQVPPGAPTEVDAYGDETTSVFISWGYVPGRPTEIEISNGETSTRVAAGLNTYTWRGLQPGTHMCFRVRAVNSAGPSDWAPLDPPHMVCATTAANGG